MAEEQFRQALDWARRQGALSWELRAATSLARLLRDHGRPAEAEAILRPVYGRFTEGFGTADSEDGQSRFWMLSASATEARWPGEACRPCGDTACVLKLLNIHGPQCSLTPSIGKPGLRPFPGVAASPGAACRRPAGQAWRPCLRRADGADRGAWRRRQQRRADGPRLAGSGRGGECPPGPDLGAARGLRAGARADPDGLRTRLPVQWRNPHCYRRAGRPPRWEQAAAGTLSVLPATNLPEPVSELIGRDDELREIAEPCRFASARHPDRPRRHRQDAARLGGRARAAAGISRRRLDRRALRRWPIPAWFPTTVAAAVGLEPAPAQLSARRVARR